MNALANHGYLPHDGRDIERDTLLDAMEEAVNFDRALSDFFFQGALETVPVANATRLSLHHLSKHNAIEHDGSLSRPDTFFSMHQDVFDPTVFAEARSYWPDPVITVRQAAAARLGRVRTANRTNPAFELSKFGETVSMTEQAIYMSALGDLTAGTVRREHVEYFFAVVMEENERLPFELGWEKSKFAVTKKHLDDMVGRVVAETGTLLNETPGMGSSTETQQPLSGLEL